MLGKIKSFIPGEIEEKVLKFWENNKIFNKSVNKPVPKGDYVFYDGPPFATGLPHYGHILASIIKDVIPRYQTMKGKRVKRRWGWDCHGLPIENVIEQELGLKTKKDIEKIGIGKFNKAAYDRVLSFSGNWKEIIPKIGRWVDMENDYKTMDSEYTESVLWVFKQLYDKKLVYEGYKSMHICPRCETTLSNFEVTQNYKEIDDISVTVKAELVDEPGTYLLAWTTTPWTLPGNVALAVGKDIEYRKIKVGNEFFIIAEKLLIKLFPTGETVLIGSPFKGKNLVGKKYKPFFDYYAKDKNLKHHKNGWKVYGANFVNTDEGTGIVHIAPAFGEDDMNLAKEKDLPFIQHVGMDGKFKKEVKDFAGLPVKPKAELRSEQSSTTGGNYISTDIEIIKWLDKNKKLFLKSKITHSYPHCWRCDTPLLNYAASSWFVKVTAIKNKLIENNKKINWIPKHLKEGRFGNWLKDARDWAISRNRYWGAPLPIWKCQKCEGFKVVGSIEEIKRNSNFSGNNYFIARHGQSETNIKNIVNYDVKKNHYSLTEKGIKQVVKAARGLKRELKGKKLDIIVSSDLLRTKQTAQIFALELGLDKSKIIFDKRIREVNTGIFGGKHSNDYHNFFSSLEEKFYKNPPKGENLTELKNRVAAFIYDLDKKYKNKNILIVSHEYPIWLIFAASAGAGAKGAAVIKSGSDKDDFIKTGEFRKLDFVPLPHNENYEMEFHRPQIDEVNFSCHKCRGVMKRIPDVFDCWFESGSMPYSQAHYPFDPDSISSRRSANYGARNKKKFNLGLPKGFPAEFIAEGVDQTRGWFYTLLVLSTGLFGKPAFKNVIANGIILAENGQKMSKRLKNYPDPVDVVNKYGADALRLYLLSSPAVRAENLNFSEKGVDEIYKKTISRLLNVYSFYEIYADKNLKFKIKNLKSNNILDKWIICRLNELSGEVSKFLDKYELDKAVRPISEFVDNLSTWYVRRSRRRLQKPENKNDFIAASRTLGFVLEEFSKIAAPFIPFVSEAIYKSVKNQEIKNKEQSNSVHLENWPVADKKLVDKKLIEEMAKIRNWASLALAKRAEAGIKVRQPLNKLKIKNLKLKIKSNKELLAILADEVNVKKVVFDNKLKGEIELDFKITSDLRREGVVREFVRMVQDLRQKAGLQPKDTIGLFAEVPEEVKNIIRTSMVDFKKEVGAKNVEFKKTSKFNAEIQTKLENQNIWMGIKKI